MENSKIEWCDHTFNPWIGCTKVSAGCTNCYAEALMDKRWGKVEWGPQGARVRTSPANWKQPLKWNRDAEREGVRKRVFCASLADVFEDKQDQPEMNVWRVELFELIRQTPNLDWLILTKRPENVNRLIEEVTFGHFLSLSDFENIWLGTSVENQEMAAKRIPELLKIPAAVRFLSMEPLLGPVDLSLVPDALYDAGMPFEWQSLSTEERGIKWVIVGGESGHNARPMHPDWVRSLRDQCNDAEVNFFFKQWGEWAPDCYCSGSSPCKTTSRSMGKPGVMFRCGKHKAGRMLDGREWNEFPKVWV